MKTYANFVACKILLLATITCLLSNNQICLVNGFVPIVNNMNTVSICSCGITSTSSNSNTQTKLYDAKTPKNSDELFASDGWEPIEKELDALPVFTCANSKGLPLQYDVNGEVMPFFYCDVDAAKVELSKAQADTQLNQGEIDIIPYPLGKAFKLAAQDKAIIIPSEESIIKAGAPTGTNPIGQQIPLFACMDIMQTKDDGTAALPLFMEYDEVQDAINEAVDIDGGNVSDFDIVCMSLERAVELLATIPEGNSKETRPAFQFLGPKSSFDHINNYLGNM